MQRRLPPLNALRAFESAARLGSFASAAVELRVTAAAISQQVKGLEAYLDLVLFERRPAGTAAPSFGSGVRRPCQFRPAALHPCGRLG